MTMQTATPLIRKTPLQRKSTLKVRSRLKTKGQRGKRLAPGDRKVSAEYTALPCLCGCNARSDPAHLVTRRRESTRHARHLIIPLDRLRHDWLDDTAEGRRCRRELLAIARAEERQPTAEEFREISERHGLGQWVMRQITGERGIGS